VTWCDRLAPAHGRRPLLHPPHAAIHSCTLVGLHRSQFPVLHQEGARVRATAAGAWAPATADGPTRSSAGAAAAWIGCRDLGLRGNPAPADDRPVVRVADDATAVGLHGSPAPADARGVELQDATGGVGESDDLAPPSAALSSPPQPAEPSAAPAHPIERGDAVLLLGAARRDGGHRAAIHQRRAPIGAPREVREDHYGQLLHRGGVGLVHAEEWNGRQRWSSSISVPSRGRTVVQVFVQMMMCALVFDRVTSLCPRYKPHCQKSRFRFRVG
jgi:hypothetical protein